MIWPITQDVTLPEGRCIQQLSDLELMNRKLCNDYSRLRRSPRQKKPSEPAVPPQAKGLILPGETRDSGRDYTKKEKRAARAGKCRAGAPPPPKPENRRRRFSNRIRSRRTGSGSSGNSNSNASETSLLADKEDEEIQDLRSDLVPPPTPCGESEDIFSGEHKPSVDSRRRLSIKETVHRISHPSRRCSSACRTVSKPLDAGRPSSTAKSWIQFPLTRLGIEADDSDYDEDERHSSIYSFTSTTSTIAGPGPVDWMSGRRRSAVEKRYCFVPTIPSPAPSVRHEYKSVFAPSVPSLVSATTVEDGEGSSQENLRLYPCPRHPSSLQLKESCSCYTERSRRALSQIASPMEPALSASGVNVSEYNIVIRDLASS